MQITYVGRRSGKSFEQFHRSWIEYTSRFFGKDVKITIHDDEKIQSLESELEHLKKENEELKKIERIYLRRLRTE